MRVKYKSPGLKHSGTCEWCPPETFLPTGTIFDHCYRHGWVRGEVCHSHNGRMNAIDQGVRQELWERRMAVQWLRCADCADTVEGVELAQHVDQPEFRVRKRTFISSHAFLFQLAWPDD